ncbi:uncharacterized protein ACA1_338980 [Acanthamoeba castellanii str. Neff]|uniref:Uncharacterized protein n=1 Tax=Acanthamoeba castellanii (strain ATCC 30010 / Neff) TaxID=1257118 RepID=L8H6L9_ACACF|nr:uncharacterized protein ACA1_338980 [Acanthamoeba castellanii str. Neff]ELR20398.1 hypothetical protein ACA1_338980 [Acanthamoeba castellanii str. Neff]
MPIRQEGKSVESHKQQLMQWIRQQPGGLEVLPYQNEDEELQDRLIELAQADKARHDNLDIVTQSASLPQAIIISMSRSITPMLDEIKNTLVQIPGKINDIAKAYSMGSLHEEAFKAMYNVLKETSTGAAAAPSMPSTSTAKEEINQEPPVAPTATHTFTDAREEKGPSTTTAAKVNDVRSYTTSPGGTQTFSNSTTISNVIEEEINQEPPVAPTATHTFTDAREEEGPSTTTAEKVNDMRSYTTSPGGTQTFSDGTTISNVTEEEFNQEPPVAPTAPVAPPATRTTLVPKSAAADYVGDWAISKDIEDIDSMITYNNYNESLTFIGGAMVVSYLKALSQWFGVSQPTTRDAEPMKKFLDQVVEKTGSAHDLHESVLDPYTNILRDSFNMAHSTALETITFNRTKVFDSNARMTATQISQHLRQLLGASCQSDPEAASKLAKTITDQFSAPPDHYKTENVERQQRCQCAGGV